MILKQISQNYPQYVSLEDLSSSLDVSIRTIQRDLKALESSLKPFDVKVVKRQNKGITLQHEHLLQVVEDILMSDNIDKNQIQRLITIYQEFMINDDFTTSNYLSDCLKVSIYTINQDIDFLSEMLSGTNILIRKKPGVGLELEGSEKDKRNGFVHLMSYYFQQEISFSIEHSEFRTYELLVDTSRIMNSSQNILFQEVKKFPFAFTDNSLHDLWMYLVISILRHQKHEIEDTHSVSDLNEKIARSIYSRLGFDIGFDPNEKEILYFASLFRSAKRVNEVIDIQTDNLVTLANELIDYVANSTGYYIEQSPQFIHGLITHLRPLLNRLQEGVFVGNPIKEQIKEDYPQLFLSIQHYFREHAMLDINEDEIGFLTLHFGVNIDSLKSVPNVRTLVICTSGIATSRMLTKRLLDSFPQMTIIEQSSLLELNQLDVDEYDLVISTVKLNNPGFDYIHIHPLLEPNDYKQIEQRVNELLLRPKEVRITEVSITNFEEQLEKIQSVTLTAQEFLKNFKVEKTNYINFENFLNDLPFSRTIQEDLLNKQKTFGFAIPKSNVALVHTRSDDLDEVIVHVYQNRSDMILKGMSNQNEKIDALVLILTPTHLINEQLELISFVSINLLEDKYVKIYSKANEPIIVEFIKGQLAQSLQNTIKKIWR